MKIFYSIFILLFLDKVNTISVKDAPMFATPKYANSYVPAAMQVIFFCVEQFKSQQLDEPEKNSTSTVLSTTISHEPGQHQPTKTTSVNELVTEQPQFIPEASEHETENSMLRDIQLITTSINEKPELIAEIPEGMYVTPETNHETPEGINEMQEINQEMLQIPENNHNMSEKNVNDRLETSTISLHFQYHLNNHSTSKFSPQDTSSSSTSSTSSPSSSWLNEEEQDKKNKESSIDSVVVHIYEIMKPQNKSEIISNNSSQSSELKEFEKDDNDQDENDENRFSIFGEKVTQVPRPSLLTYLRRTKLSFNCTSIQELALLYDALSKDVRSQGFSKYSGYSDEVLKFLVDSSEGGMSSQLKLLLEKIAERHEITRADAKSKMFKILEYLNDPSSQLNRDLRPLFPLTFQL